MHPLSSQVHKKSSRNYRMSMSIQKVGRLIKASKEVRHLTYICKLKVVLLSYFFLNKIIQTNAIIHFVLFQYVKDLPQVTELGSTSKVYATVVSRDDHLVRRDGQPFDAQDYERNPELYYSNCMYLVHCITFHRTP